MKRKIIAYNPNLKSFANKLRKKMTFGETALWRAIKNKKLGVRFSRQIPIVKEEDIILILYVTV